MSSQGADAPQVSQAFQLAARAIMSGGEGETPVVGRPREGVIKGLELLNGELHRREDARWYDMTIVASTPRVWGSIVTGRCSNPR